MASSKLGAIREEYLELRNTAEQFCEKLVTELKRVVEVEELTLAVPIEWRVKSWKSIAEKLKRRQLRIKSVREIRDLCGIRVIFLFQRDIEPFVKALRAILDSELPEEKMPKDVDVFGYGSTHMQVRVKPEWSNVPTFSAVQGWDCEMQLRTISQHAWAAMSHKMQYKIESSVPRPLRRSIHRLSALLELVDLEFERILSDRGRYVEFVIKGGGGDILDADVLRSVVLERWPEGDNSENPDYADLFGELALLGITSRRRLEDIIEKNRQFAIERDLEQRDGDEVCYSSVGLTRMALSGEFGEHYERLKAAIASLRPG